VWCRNLFPQLVLAWRDVRDRRRCEDIVQVCVVVWPSVCVCVCVVVANACDGPDTNTWVGGDPPTTAVGISDPHCLLAGPLLAAIEFQPII
jgi:hypothetical protein